MLVINSHSAVKMEQVEGRWYSDQLYTGRQYVQVSAIQVGTVTSLVAAKITGDENVPKGCITWKSLTWPAMGAGRVPAELQARSNPIDPLGFYFFPAFVSLVSRDEIVVSIQSSPTDFFTASFYKSS